MDKLLEEAKAALTALPPGPWTAYGTTVYAGSQVVAVVPQQGWRGEQIARTLARMPDLIHLLVVVGPETMMDRITALSEENERLQDRITDLEIDRESKSYCDELGN